MFLCLFYWGIQMKLIKENIKWLDLPEEHDYPAAASYLELIYDEVSVKSIVINLEYTSITTFKAKDIFRASGLSLLGISNGHIKKNMKKIKDGKSLSPLLLVRDTINGKVIIADGYHRLCTIYQIDEDAEVPCKIA